MSRVTVQCSSTWGLERRERMKGRVLGDFPLFSESLRGLRFLGVEGKVLCFFSQIRDHMGRYHVVFIMG